MMEDNHTAQLDEENLSPLEQIRHTESEVTRRVASARQVAEKALIKARNQANQQRVQAQDEGSRQGQADYQAAISSAEEEASQILAQARKQADVLLIQGEGRLNAAVYQAVEFILGGVGAKEES